MQNDGNQPTIEKQAGINLGLVLWLAEVSAAMEAEYVIWGGLNYCLIFLELLSVRFPKLIGIGKL